MQHRDLCKKALTIIVIVSAVVFHPVVPQAKPADEQNQIILLNDSAAALENTNTELSKSLAQFADEKQKEWEANNANKKASLPPASDINSKQLQERIKLLNAAALVIKPTYPLIAQGLNKMVKDLSSGTIEVKK